MAKKIYLSAAAHATDNPTKCPKACGENVHCKAYMDIVETRLKALGFDVKRTGKTLTGDKALTTRVTDANEWGADLYYVAHTNAGGGRYSMTMHYPDADSQKKAEVLHKYRKCVESHKVVSRSDLYEINATKMTCLYDELIFHDNATDCKWFHDGGMKKLAEETVQAICELCGVTYKAETAAKPVEKPATKPAAKPTTKTPQKGDPVVLKNQKLYVASTGLAAYRRTGTFYLYDGKKVNGRYRVTNSKDRVGKTPIASNVSGWVEL